MPHRTLVLGGIRSGKSEWAERRLAADPVVRYVAPAPARPDDEEWAARVAAHRARRPAHWTTVETVDVAGELRTTPTAGPSLLVDDVGGWLTAVLDRAGPWWADDAAAAAGRESVDELVSAWSAYAGRAVLVTPEVGLSLVAGTAAGRRYADLLGEANRALADHSDEVVLVVAGRPLWLHGSPA